MRAFTHTILCAFFALALACAPLVAWADDATAVSDGAGSASAQTSADSSSHASSDSSSQVVDGSALMEGIDFGINNFERNAKGTARAADGAPEGYRFPQPVSATMVVVRTPENILVYVDAAAAASAEFDLADESDRTALQHMIEQLDEAWSMGGALLSEAGVPWVFTTELEVTQGVYTYRFGVDGGDGNTYTTVTLAGAPAGEAGGAAAKERGVDLGDGALWCDNAELISANYVTVEALPSFTDRAWEFFSGIDYRPLWVSVKTAGIALVVSFVLGLAAAWRVMGTSSRFKGLLDSVFTVPMVLPPTVCGFLLLMLFGQSTAVGRWLIDHGIALVFTWPAAVLSAVVVSFPLVYRTALGAFEALDAHMLDAARTLGWSELRIFRKIMLPLAWPSIAAGTVLAFARAMGEFGCTLFFAGNYAGVTQTIPIAIYFEWMGGNTPVALFWVAVVIVFSFLVILFINWYTARSQAFRHGARSDVQRGRAGRVLRGVRGMKADETSDQLADDLEATGGDALRIDREALRALLAEEGRA